MNTPITNPIAEVYLNVGNYSFDRPLDYRIPCDFINDIKPGTFVRVPFKNNTVFGLVTRVKRKTTVDRSDLKDIITPVTKRRLLDKDRLKLIYWLSKYYFQPISRIYRLFLPPGIDQKKIGHILDSPESNLEYTEIIALGKTEDLLKKDKSFWKKNKAKKRIIDYIREKGEAEKKEVLKNTKSSINTLRQLINGKLLISKKIRLKKDKSYLINKEYFLDKDITINNAQKKVTEEIFSSIKNNKYHNYILEGVTGSGKTIVYLELAKKLLKKKKRLLVMTPEIFLTPQLFSRFYDFFKDRVAFYHSNMSAKERYEIWIDTWNGEYDIIIGTRSALFLPIKDLGCIILDEGHDVSYKESSSIRYNTYSVAKRLAKIYKIPTVYGSATPSVGVIYKIKTDDEYSHLSLPYKAAGSSLLKEVIDLKEKKSLRGQGIITNGLHKEIFNTLSRGNKVIIFLNRRGHSNFLICNDCGYIPKCKDCDVSYTYHDRKEDNLLCHHCNQSRTFNGKCDVCGSKRVSFCGTGIQKVERELRRRFKDYHVYRMDSDSTSKRRSHSEILKEFIKKGPAILIGTQMVTKGLDIEDITLIGILNCESMMELPDFHMHERVYQNIVQVTGRTARKTKDGKVIIQAYNPDNKVIKHFMGKGNEAFYEDELSNRKELEYPPYSNLVNIIVSGIYEKEVKNHIMYLFTEINKITKIKLKVLGPAPAPFSRIKKYYRWHIMIKTDNIYRLNNSLQKIIKEKKDSKRLKTIVDIEPEWVL